MKNILPSFLMLLLVGLLQGFLVAQAPTEHLTLDDFLAQARTQALAKNQALLDIRQAELNFKIYRAGLKPSLEASANLPNYAKTFSEITQPDGTVLFQSVTNNNSAVGLQILKNITATGGTLFASSELQRFDNFETNEHLYNGNPIRVGFVQPLLSFNPLKWDKQIEPLKLAEAQKQFATDVENINTQAMAIFADLLIVNQELKIAQTNEKGNETLFQHAEEKFRLGKISQRDLMRLQLELIMAKKDQKRAEQSLANASVSAFNFLGKPQEGKIILAAIPEFTLGNKVEEELALRMALENRPDLLTFQRIALEASRDLDQAKKDAGLNLDLQASFGLVRSSKSISDIYRDPRPQQFAQLQINVPLLDWGRQKSMIALAAANQDFVQQQIQQQELLFESEIRQLVEEINYLQEELALSEDIQKVAAERFEITQQSFVLGAINTTELILAQQERDQASRAYIYSVRDYWQAYFQLRRLTLFDFEKEKNIIYNF